MTEAESWVALGVVAVLFLVGCSLLFAGWRDWFGNDE